MKKTYTIELNYKMSFTQTVEAEDEGQAMEIVREMAEEADMDEFIVGEELDANVLLRGE